MADGSVGSVFLDLVVRDTVDKQVQDLAAKAQTALQKSFSGIENTISAAVQKTVERAAAAATSAAANAGKAAESAANAAEKAVQSAASSAASCGQQVEASIDKSFNRAVALAQAKVNELETSLARVTEKLQTAIESDDDSAAEKFGDKQIEIYDKLAAARERLAIEVQTAAQKQLAAEKAAAQQAAEPVKSMVQEAAQTAESSSQAVESAVQGPLQRMVEKVRKIGDAIANGPARALGTLAEETNQTVDSVEDLSESAEEQSSAFTKIKNVASKAFSTVKSVGAKAFETAGKAANGFKNVASKAFSGIKKVASGFGKAISSIKNKFSSAGKSAGGFGQRIKGLASRAFVFNIISSGFRSVSSSLQTAMTSSDSMQNALANLKGAAATAAAPIIEMLTPALTALTNAAATAFSYLSKLISSLTGKSISAMSSTAKKMQSTADTAKKAVKSVAGFDEIQKLDSGDSSSSDGNSDAYNYAFEGQSSFLDSVIESVKAGNWGDVGAIIAGKFNSAISSIDTVDVGAKIGGFVDKVVKTVNGFFKTLNFSNIGKKIGETFSNTLSKIDWATVGNTVAKALTALPSTIVGFIQNTDWVVVANSISTSLISTFDGITEWITSVDWQDIGNKIALFISSIDWSGLVSSLVESIGAALGGLAALLWGLIEDAWANVVKWWKDVAYEDGKFTMEGLLKGIGDIFVNIGTWIKENIFDPFINGFKKAFDIHSPSGEMESMGDFLIQGLFQGISKAWTSITSFFTNAFKSVKKSMTEIWENGIVPAIKGPINRIIGFINGMISGVCDGINTIIKAMNKLSFDIPDWDIFGDLAGKTFGFNLKTVVAPQIPMLANGGVITQPTLAMMGEYAGARSNPEIAAPQSLIEQTLANAMQGYSGDMINRLEEVVSVLKDILEAVLGIEIGDAVIGQAVERYKRGRAIMNGGVW